MEDRRRGNLSAAAIREVNQRQARVLPRTREVERVREQVRNIRREKNRKKNKRQKDNKKRREAVIIKFNYDLVIVPSHS